MMVGIAAGEHDALQGRNHDTPELPKRIAASSAQRGTTFSVRPQVHREKPVIQWLHLKNRHLTIKLGRKWLMDRV
jgi:hypothetical protein